MNEGRRIAHITKAGILIPPTQSDAEKAKGLLAPSEIQHNLFDGYHSGQTIALGENEAQIFRSEQFDVNTALKLEEKATAYVEDTSGKRLTAEFFVGSTPKNVQKKQQKETEPTLHYFILAPKNEQDDLRRSVLKMTEYVIDPKDKI